MHAARTVSTRTNLLILLAILATPATLVRPAQASCIAPTMCLCTADTRVVVQAQVVDVNEKQAGLVIEAIANPAGAPLDLAVGATAVTSAIHYDIMGKLLMFKKGEHLLGTVVGPQATVGQPGTVRAIVPIDADGHVTCVYATTFRPTTAAAIDIMSSSNCPAAMKAAGYVEPGCNDTSVESGVGGCAAAPAGASWGWAAVLAACAAAGWAWRRRRFFMRS